MSARAAGILGRFPAHLEPARPGKQLSAVVEALCGDLDLLSADLAAVRRSHRIGHAGTLRDVLLLAGLHGLTSADLGVLFTRVARLRDLAGKVEAAIGRSAEDRDRWAEALFDLFGVDAPRPRLALYAPFHEAGEAPDLDRAARAFAAVVRSALASGKVVDAARTRVVEICRIHSRGNGTVRALLEAAAGALDLEIDLARNTAVKQALRSRNAGGTLELHIDDEFFHSRDLFWHSTFVRDRAPLTRTVPTKVPAKLVRMNERIALSELADQMGLGSADVLRRLAELGMAGVRPDSELDLPVAERVAGLFGFEVERHARGLARMEWTITVAELARRLALPVGTVLARLDALGAAGLTGDSTLEPALAARIARRYGYGVEQTLPALEELLGIEENPLRREEYRNEECSHGHLFRVIRRGFGRELLRARVAGVEDRTVGPMVVNRDEGRGVGYSGAVPAGATLTFTEEGRVLLDGADVTSFAFSWEGACFAGAAEPDRRDFVLDGPGADPRRRAVFAVPEPDGALDRDFAFPHAGGDITVPGVGVGVTRMAFFVQQAHLSSREGPEDAATVRRVTPRPSIGFADQSVFAAVPPELRPAPDAHPDGDYQAPKAADLHLSWLEHEAYALRVIIPRRFALLDTEAPPITERVGRTLGRFGPAGVEIRVEYVDDRWLLGRGVVVDEGAEDPNLMLRGGTVLWSPPPGG